MKTTQLVWVYFLEDYQVDEKKYNIEEGGGGHFSGLTFSYRFKKYIFAVVTEKGALNIKSVNYSMTYQF